MDTSSFLKPRLVGPRFTEHAIPLEILRDLAALEEMLVEVAKWKLLQEHPERKRAPRGFAQGIELQLTAIEKGSAIPVIALHIDPASPAPLTIQTYLEKGRDSIVNAIRAAEQGSSISAHLPESLLSYFDRFGRGLRDGEALEFDWGNENPARLTRETRRKLVLAASDARQFTEETTLRGLVPAADQDNETFEVQTWDGRKIKAPLQPQHAATILEAFQGYRRGVRVLLQGIGRFTRQERLEAFESIEHAVCLDPLDVAARLDEFLALKEGWLDGRLGKAPEPDHLRWLQRAFENHYPEELVLPWLYPTAEGGVQAEWVISQTEISLDIDISSRRGTWHALNLETQHEDMMDLDLGQPQGWEQVAEKIRQVGGSNE